MHPESHSPKVSLVICTYNRCGYLPETFGSIAAQSLAFDLFEVLVVDNASTDDTAAVTQKFMADHPELPFRYCFEGNKGLSYARNRGWTEAAAPVVAYVDDDVILTPDYLTEVVAFFDKNPRAMGGGGRVVPKYETGAEPVWMSKYLNGFVGRVNHGTEIKRFEEGMKYPAGCNMIYKKEILQKAGGFNNALKARSDDKYIFLKVRELTPELYYLPDAWLYHYIDAHRLEKDYFVKLFLKTGNEEKQRLKSEGGGWKLVKKLLEYGFKTAASIGLYGVFLAKGQPQKGQYVLLSQWSTLKGFLKKEVFVR